MKKQDSVQKFGQVFTKNTTHMIKKFAFTEAGFVEASAYFHGLSDAELWTQVYAVQQDVKSWIPQYFDIQGDDLTCLLSFNAHCTFILANQLAVTMSLRLPFRLERTTTAPEVSVLGVKRGRGYNPIGTRFTGEDAPEGEGEFVYTIEE